jgi:hypothetical protein
MDSQTDKRAFIYHIDGENRLCFVNEDWLDFARENGAPELTRAAVFNEPLARFIDDWETLNLYELIFRRVRATGTGVLLPFRCDTPGLRRFMQLSLRLLDNGEIELTGRVLATEERHPVPLLDPAAPRSKTMITICSWCKKVKTKNDLYVEIEKAISVHGLFGPRHPRLTHGICPECFERIRKELDL